jgi:hypothetical protein
MLKIPAENGRDKFTDISRQLTVSVLNVPAATTERWWMNH